MSVVPYPIQVYRDAKWTEIQTDQLLPGDLVSIGKLLYFFDQHISV
jgi:Cation transport ATPase